MNPPTPLRAGDHGADVTVVQTRLTRAGFAVTPSGLFDEATRAAVCAFQASRGLVVDGVVGPRTQSALMGQTDVRALTQASIETAAQTLGCESAALQAVIQVESPQGGYLPDGRVVILFERHIFWKQLVAAGIDPTRIGARADILSQQRGGYVGGVGEYHRLATATAVAIEPAMASCSWGRFQIMGFHAQALGYDSAVAMASAFALGESEQLTAFVRHIESDKPLHKALRKGDWAAFARGYNGLAYADNLYDSKLAIAYRLHRQMRANGISEPAP